MVLQLQTEISVFSSPCCLRRRALYLCLELNRPPVAFAVEVLNISQHRMGELGGLSRPERTHEDAQTLFLSLTTNRSEITQHSDLTVSKPGTDTWFEYSHWH